MNISERFEILSDIEWSIRRAKELHETTLLDLQKAIAQNDRSSEGYLRGKECGIDSILVHLEMLQKTIKAGV